MVYRTPMPKAPNHHDVTIAQVLNAKILPAKQLIYIGLGWYRDPVSGTCYHVERKDNVLVVTETRNSKITYEIKKPKTVTITCIDCGAERIIATQDAFQVKRCKDCQRKLKNTKRLVRIREQRALAKQQKEQK